MQHHGVHTLRPSQAAAAAAGCLVRANPWSPAAELLGHVGMKAAPGWHAAQAAGSNPQLGARISISEYEY